MKKLFSLLLLVVLCFSTLSLASAKNEVDYVLAYEIHTQNKDSEHNIKNAYLVISTIDGSKTLILDSLTWEQNESLVDIYNLFIYKWSPDGTMIAVSVAAPTFDKFDYSLKFYSKGGDLLKNIPKSYQTYDFSWTPDSRSLIYTESTSSQGNRIERYSVSEDKEDTLVYPSITNTFNSSPVVSPNQKEMFFMHQEWGTKNYSLVVSYEDSQFPYGGVDFYNDHVDPRIKLICSDCWGNIIFWSADSEQVFMTYGGGNLDALNLEHQERKIYPFYCGSFQKMNHSDNFVCKDYSGNITITDLNKVSEPKKVILNVHSLGSTEQTYEGYTYSGVGNIPSYVRVSRDDKMFLFTDIYDAQPKLWIITADGASYWEVSLPEFSDQLSYVITSFDW